MSERDAIRERWPLLVSWLEGRGFSFNYGRRPRWQRPTLDIAACQIERGNIWCALLSGPGGYDEIEFFMGATRVTFDDEDEAIARLRALPLRYATRLAPRRSK